MKRFLFAGALVLQGLVGVGDLAAQENEGEETRDEAARRLFEAGTHAYEQGDFEGARVQYEQAYDLSARPELLYNIAGCYDRLDQRQSALEYYERFLEALPDSSSAPVARSRTEVLRRALAPESEEPAEPAQVEPAPENAAHGRNWIGPITAFAVAGAGLVTFATAGLIANGRHGDAETECRMVGCDESKLDAIDRGALIADIGLGVAIAGAVTGTLWLLLAGRGDEGEETVVAPAVSPTTAGLTMRGSF